MIEINTITVIGRLVNVPKYVEFDSGKKVCNFRLATSLGKPKDGRELTQYIDCQAWDKTATIVNQFAHKGSTIGVSGTINSEVYEKNNTNVYHNFIVVRNFQHIRNSQAYVNASSGKESTPEQPTS